MTRDGDAKEKDGKGEDKRPDAELSQDELAERRAARASNGNGSASIAQRARDGEEPEEELFPLGTLDGDPKRTLKTLLRSGVPIEYTASLMSAEVPLQGGALDMENNGQALVTWEPAKVEIVPDREVDSAGGRKLVRAKVRHKLRPTFVQAAGSMFTEEQVVEMLEAAEVPAAKIAKLLGHEDSASAQG
jgi:hypothetical protein